MHAQSCAVQVRLRQRRSDSPTFVGGKLCLARVFEHEAPLTRGAGRMFGNYGLIFKEFLAMICFMSPELRLSSLLSKVEKAKKIGFVLTPLATGLTVWEAASANPLAVVYGACAVVLAGATVVNIRTARRFRLGIQS
ncbi:MAG: hypothetical protein UU67_C0047G0007 [Candidatus Daviesbacteria bacterium GW2011_GWB1_41_5]|nr:MAG: hypothetical protein UU67_C0047G0007 [Candidatus Daviesbacteria bacterium GW2011_GWB1_41_5]